MRTLDINKRTIFYALRIGTEENSIGEIKNIYSRPIPFKCVVTSASTSGLLSSGSNIIDLGMDTYQGLKLITSCMNLPWDDFTLFWIDRKPTEEHDYVMGKPPARRINNISYFIEKRGDI